MNRSVWISSWLTPVFVHVARADEFITAGVVSVNGEVVTELGTKIKRSDVVKFHDEPVKHRNKVYVLLNKPKDTVTTSDDPQERRTVMDLVKGACNERIYPVGRLDRNTTGVLLLTNDGDLFQADTPEILKKKIYHVHLDKNLTKRIWIRLQLVSSWKMAKSCRCDQLYRWFQERPGGIEIHPVRTVSFAVFSNHWVIKWVKLDRVFLPDWPKRSASRRLALPVGSRSKLPPHGFVW